LSEKRTEKKPERAPEPPRNEDRRKSEPPRELEALDEQSLDEVLRDCRFEYRPRHSGRRVSGYPESRCRH